MSTETAPPPDAGAPPAESAPPWESTVFVPDKPGEFDKDWHTKAPEEERGKYEPYKGAKNWREALDLADGRVKEAQTALRNRAKEGGPPVRPEGDAATPEAWKAYREFHGIPDDPKGYGIEKPKDYPDEMWNQAEMEGFAKYCHDNDIKGADAKKVLDYYNERGLVAFATVKEARAAQMAAEAKARADYIQTQKETLVQNHGVRLDSDLKALGKIAAISGLDGERLNPDNADQFVGADVIKVLSSMYAMLPKSGDPTARALGRNDANGAPKDRAYWQSVKANPQHPDYIAWLNPKDPRHAEVNRAMDVAYQVDSQQREEKR